MLKIIITAVVEQNAEGEREHTKKKAWKENKGMGKETKSGIKQVYCLKGKKLLNKC